jgi:hypothetical protein
MAIWKMYSKHKKELLTQRRPAMTTNSFTMIGERPAQNPRMRLHAGAIFNEVRGRAVFGQLKALVLGGLAKRAMPSLSSRLSGRELAGQHALGQRTIEIERIVGSESRAEGFDHRFNPLSDSIRERWVSIAAFCLNDIGLPAVDLIQVGEEYFVRDGHHRVSVARALGWAFIDARVTKLELK